MNPDTKSTANLALITLVLVIAFQARIQAEEVRVDLAIFGRKNAAVFTRIDEIKLVPKEVLRMFSAGIGDPGEPYQATDFIQGDILHGKILPFRRLIFAATAMDYCLVHFEKGGIAHAFYIVLFHLTARGASPVWVSSSDHFSTIAELAERVKAQRLKNEIGHTSW